MAQKDNIFGGSRGSSQPVKPSYPLWKNILVFSLLIALVIGSIYVVGGLK